MVSPFLSTAQHRAPSGARLGISFLTMVMPKVSIDRRLLYPVGLQVFTRRNHARVIKLFFDALLPP